MEASNGKQDIQQQDINGGFPKNIMGKIGIRHFHQ